MKIQIAALAVTLASLAGCGTHEFTDIDSNDEVWVGQGEELKWLVLRTYEGDVNATLDVRSQLNGASEGSYKGPRAGSADTEYEFDLSCAAPGSAGCDALGDRLELICELIVSGTARLECNSVTFDRVDEDFVSQ